MPEVINTLINYVNSETGQYPTVPPNPGMTTAPRFVEPPPSLSYPFRQGGAPGLNPIAAAGNPLVAEAFRSTAPGASPTPQPGVDPNRPPDPPIPGLDRFAVGGKYPGLLG